MLMKIYAKTIYATIERKKQNHYNHAISTVVPTCSEQMCLVKHGVPNVRGKLNEGYAPHVTTRVSISLLQVCALHVRHIITQSALLW